MSKSRSTDPMMEKTKKKPSDRYSNNSSWKEKGSIQLLESYRGKQINPYLRYIRQMKFESYHMIALSSIYVEQCRVGTSNKWLREETTDGDYMQPFKMNNPKRTMIVGAE